MTFDPSNTLRFGQGFFPPNLVAIGYFEAIWPLVDPRWPLCDLWPQQCTTFWSGILLNKFGSHRAFLRQIDPWMTFDSRWGHFENMPTNLVGPSPTPMPTFSSIPQSVTKRIAVHIPIHAYRLCDFSSIDKNANNYVKRRCNIDSYRRLSVFKYMLSTEDSTDVTLILIDAYQCLGICYLLKIAPM